MAIAIPTRFLLAVALACSSVASAVIAWSPANAAGVQITVTSYEFTPAVRTVALGMQVTWVFQGSTPHSTVSRQGFWASPLHNGGEIFGETFNGAGSYPYFCQPHESFMQGAIRVRMAVTENASSWTMRWSSWSTTPDNRRFDVQVKRPGSDRWRAFRTDTTAAKTNFDPSTGGTYRFRARTENLAAGSVSKWSPVTKVVA